MSPWRSEHEAWIRANVTSKTGTIAELAAFKEAFPFTPTLAQFSGFAARVLRGYSVPPSPVSSLDELALHIPWRTFLVISDLQCPYHDAELLERVISLAEAWDVEGVIDNGDHFDFATVSKFSPSVYGDRVPLGEELRVGGDILDVLIKRLKRLVLVPGNHDLRLVLRLLEGQLAPDQAQRLLSANENLVFTQLSWLWADGFANDERIRITHPGAASVVAGTVGADISRNYDCHVIVAHDHLLCQRRSHSGRWTVTHSGILADRTRLGYSFAIDNRRPLMNQGAVLVHPDREGRPIIQLLDAMNTDWELEHHIAAHRPRYAPAKEAA